MKNVVVFVATGKLCVSLIDYLTQHLSSSVWKIIATGRRNTEQFGVK